jgi:2-iminobutanoate/2-iminopropanoate deaminase
MVNIFSTAKAPKAIWPYSSAYEAGDLLFCSWQIGIDPETMELVVWWIEDETRQACRNLKEVLAENRLGLKDVVKTTLYLKNIQDLETVNNIYRDYFIMKPARSIVAVGNLPTSALIEIDAIAKKS